MGQNEERLHVGAMLSLINKSRSWSGTDHHAVESYEFITSKYHLDGAPDDID